MRLCHIYFDLIIIICGVALGFIIVKVLMLALVRWKCFYPTVILLLFLCFFLKLDPEKQR